tara:strand:- start:2317 stop:3099 length:783 start_codon:yes stop_codon:yes gene_type:complete
MKKIIGIIPARLAATRFPNKPLKNICGVPMLQHVFERSKLYKNWTYLAIATCDKKIHDFSKKNRYPSIQTSNKHTRCLDRVYEATKKIQKRLKIHNNDIIVCVQGDEPMLKPQMINSVVKPILKNSKINATVLGVEIISPEQFYDKNIVKIVHDMKNQVLYTSRSPVPFCDKFSKKIKAKRVGGIFAFQWKFLKNFFNIPESNLEKIEACDSNRICDNGGGQYVSYFKNLPYFSVDTKKDLAKVSRYMKKDKIFKKIFKK